MAEGSDRWALTERALRIAAAVARLVLEALKIRHQW
jgi:hypothetical protein